MYLVFQNSGVKKKATTFIFAAEFNFFWISWGRMESLVQKCLCGCLLSFAVVTQEPFRHLDQRDSVVSFSNVTNESCPNATSPRTWDQVQLPFLNFKINFRSVQTTIKHNFHGVCHWGQGGMWLSRVFLPKKAERTYLFCTVAVPIVNLWRNKRRFLSFLLCFSILTEESWVPYYNVKCLSSMVCLKIVLSSQLFFFNTSLFWVLKKWELLLFSFQM